MTEVQAYTIAQILETHPQCEVAWIRPGEDCGQPGCTCREMCSVAYRVTHVDCVYFVYTFSQVRPALKALDDATILF